MSFIATDNSASALDAFRGGRRGFIGQLTQQPAETVPTPLDATTIYPLYLNMNSDQAVNTVNTIPWNNNTLGSWQLAGNQAALAAPNGLYLCQCAVTVATGQPTSTFQVYMDDDSQSRKFVMGAIAADTTTSISFIFVHTDSSTIVCSAGNAYGANTTVAGSDAYGLRTWLRVQRILAL